jgi:exonuclease SbcD
MRILHTSDWHLGKRLFKLDRGEEHRLFLNWLIETILRE